MNDHHIKFMDLSSKRFALAVVILTLAGCAITPVRQGNPTTLQASRSGKVLVFGRINYEIDGQIKAPYGLFRPRWPAPIMNATRLEDGSAVNSPAVANSDGNFLWELPPGHYVITRLGVGQFIDDTYIAWPRVAFRIPAGANLAYLGHLVLAGTTRTNEFTYSTGRKSRTVGVVYQFKIRDEMSEHRTRLMSKTMTSTSPPVRSLMFHQPGMPIGDRFLELWLQSPTGLIESVFHENTRRNID